MARMRVWSCAALALLVVPSTAPVAQPPIGLTQEVVSLRAEDGGRLYATYVVPQGKTPKTAIVFMHPRGGNVTHFALEPLARQGFATLGRIGPTAVAASPSWRVWRRSSSAEQTSSAPVTST